MRIGALLLLAGCQNLFGLRSIPGPDGHAAGDAHDAALGSADAPADGLRIIDATAPLPAMIQQSSSSANGSGLDVTMKFTPIAGDTLVLVGGATCGLNSVTGGGVGVWMVAADSEVSPTDTIFFGVTNGSSSSIHLAAKCTTEVWGLASEWSGLAPINNADASNHLGAVTSVPGSLVIAVSPSNAPDLLMFGVSSYGSLGSPAAPWTELDQILVGPVTQRTWYQVALTASQYTASVSVDSDYDASIAAFRAQ